MGTCGDENYFGSRSEQFKTVMIVEAYTWETSSTE